MQNNYSARQILYYFDLSWTAGKGFQHDFKAKKWGFYCNVPTGCQSSGYNVFFEVESRKVNGKRQFAGYSCPVDIHFWTWSARAHQESLLGIRLKVKVGLKVLLPQTWKWQQAGDATAQRELGLESMHTCRIYISNSALTRAPHHSINLSQPLLYSTTHEEKAFSWKQLLLYREAVNASDTRRNQLQLAKQCL